MVRAVSVWRVIGEEHGPASWACSRSPVPCEGFLEVRDRTLPGFESVIGGSPVARSGPPEAARDTRRTSAGHSLVPAVCFRMNPSAPAARAVRS